MLTVTHTYTLLVAGREGGSSDYVSGGLTWPSGMAQCWMGEGLPRASEAALGRGERVHLGHLRGNAIALESPSSSFSVFFVCFLWTE